MTNYQSFGLHNNILYAGRHSFVANNPAPKGGQAISGLKELDDKFDKPVVKDFNHADVGF
jgi:hypothetical protein